MPALLVSLWSKNGLPESLDRALALSLRYIFWVCSLIGAPAVCLACLMRLYRGDGVLESLMVPLVYMSGILLMPLVLRHCSVAGVGRHLALWLSGIAIANQITDKLMLGSVICWMVTAVVCGVFVDLLFLLCISGLMIAGYLLSQVILDLGTNTFSITVVTLFFSMLGVAVGVRFIRLMLVEAFERELQLRRQVEESDAARRDAERSLTAAQHYSVLGRIAGGVAHDMNNVLTVVFSTSDLLLMGLPEDQARSCIDDMKSIAAEMATSTRELLSYVPRSRCVPRLVCAAALVDRMGRTLRRVLPESVALECRTSGNGQVLMDPSDLQRVILNLVVNARDAMPEGGRIVVSVNESEGEAGRSEVCIEVLDTGTGMPEEVQRRLFEPFFTTKPPGHGTGLGLKMVRQMIEESGGSVSVRSSVGKGSCFTLRLPRQEGVEAGPAAPAQKAAPQGAGGRVLLAVQWSHMRDLARSILERGGFTVSCLQEGCDPLRTIAEDPAADLLILDTDYRGAELSAVCDAFGKRSPGAGILLMIGAVQGEGLAALMRRPGVDSIERPFSATQLLGKVDALLG